MFRHVVTLTFGDVPEAHIEAVIDALRELPGAISEIRSYVVGRDVGLNPQNAHLVVVADFDDEAGYLVYRDHPEHQRVITTLIAPHLSARSAVQHVT